MNALACTGLSWPSAIALASITLAMFGCFVFIIWVTHR